MIGSIISWLVAGLVVGLIAKLILPGKQNIPLWLTVVLGIIGAGAGTLIAKAGGFDDTPGIDWWKHIFQVAIAAALIWIVTALMNRRSPTATLAPAGGRRIYPPEPPSPDRVRNIRYQERTVAHLLRRRRTRDRGTR